MGWNQNLSRADSVSRLMLAIWLFGTLTSDRSSVRMRVERRPMCSTVPSIVPILQEVADPDGLIEDERRTGDDVLERLLRGQRDGDAADAEAGEDRRRIDAEVPQHREHATDHDHDVRQRRPTRSSDTVAEKFAGARRRSV